MATPLLKPINIQGGTFYVFPSATLNTKLVSDDNTKFVFSKFACLDLPKSAIPQNDENNLNLSALGNNELNSFDNVVLNDITNSLQKHNIHLANSFQNYVLNLETHILENENSNGDSYDNTIQKTVSERVFFKWLTTIGAIRFDSAINESNLSSSIKEEDSNDYKKVVQYLGDIDIVNNVSDKGQSYTEVYLYIPTSHGNTNSVLFNTISDNNYSSNLHWTSDSNLIKGRSSHVDNTMSINAYYDDNTLNRYNTKNDFNDISNSIVELATDIGGLNTYNILQSNVDGVSIDWNEQNYKSITSNSDINLLSELNASAFSEDFKFNAVLVYYDLYNQDDPTNVTRNLYGVLFIDDFQETISEGAYLKSFRKFKPNPISKLNGNSYGLKLNVKVDNSADNVGIETVINEYNTFSMHLYSNALIEMQNTLDRLNSNTYDVNLLMNKVNEVEQYLLNINSIKSLEDKVNELQSLIQNSNFAFSDKNALIDLIANNSQRINRLASGELGNELSYDIGILNNGLGIQVDASTPNKIKLNNTVQAYNNISICYNQNGKLNYDNGNGNTNINDSSYGSSNNILQLKYYSNYFKNKTDNSVFTNDIIINIDDTIKWKTGQSFKISFLNTIETNNNSKISIYTDSLNRFNTGAYKWLIGHILSSDISTKPIFEIICVDENKYLFEIDILK